MTEALKIAVITVLVFFLAPFFGILLSIGVLLFLLGMPLWLTVGGYFNKKRCKDEMLDMRK